jgi:4'-phosphopantetheinyl transferase
MDGAPEVWIGGGRAPVSLSLSHRGERALAVATRAPSVVGCDLELIEPRSEAFQREWLAPAEQEQLTAAAPEHAPLLVNLLWAGKEAAAKLRREGLRLNVRQLVVTPGPARNGWAPLTVSDGGEGLEGWWRADAGYVMTVVCDPASKGPGDEVNIDERLEREAQPPGWKNMTGP